MSESLIEELQRRKRTYPYPSEIKGEIAKKWYGYGIEDAICVIRQHQGQPQDAHDINAVTKHESGSNAPSDTLNILTHDELFTKWSNLLAEAYSLGIQQQATIKEMLNVAQIAKAKGWI